MREEAWYDEFWSTFFVDEDDGISAARLLGELMADEAVYRDGDWLISHRGECKTFLSVDDQHLVRRIEEAVKHANNLGVRA